MSPNATLKETRGTKFEVIDEYGNRRTQVAGPDDEFEPEPEIESAFFADPDAGIEWLAEKGCSRPEAERIVRTGLAFITAQSTGEGPTRFEQIMGVEI